MKINANEMLLMQNNLKAANGGMKHYENPVPQTGYAINAIAAQGMKNVVFQGAQAQTLSASRKSLNKLFLAAGAFVAGLFTQSCHDYDPYKIEMKENTTINSNTTINNNITVNYNNMVDTVSHYQYNQNNPTLDSLLVEQKKTNNLLQLLVTSQTISEQNRENYMQLIINMYNEAMAKADDRDAAMAQFMADVRELLEGILQNTNDIKIDLAAHRAESNQFYKDIKAEVDSIKNDGRMTLNTTIEISEKMDSLNSKQDSIRADINSFKSFVNDYYLDVIAILNGGTSPNINITKDDLQAMFNALGITVSQAVSDAKDDLLAAIGAAGQAIVDNNNQNFAALQADLADIKLTLDDIKALLEHSNVQRDSLLAKADSSLAKADSVIVLLNKINEDQNANHAEVMAAHAETVAAINDVKVSVDSLSNFVQNNIINMADLDSLIHKYAFDKLPANVDTMKTMMHDFALPVYNRINQYIDYVMNIDTTYIDGSEKQMLKAILDRLINLQLTCECHCNCGNNTGNPNEGVGDPTGGNIGDLFAKNDALNDFIQKLDADKLYRVATTKLFQA